MRRSTLHCALLLAFALAGYCFQRDVVAQTVETPTEGSLRIVDSAGKLAQDIPLRHTSVRAAVSGFVARVTVTQDFENPSSAFLPRTTAVYEFPLPQTAAVDDLTMIIGERTVKGMIVRHDDAQAAYIAARSQGRIILLRDEARSNIFKQPLTNILPGKKIRIVISYVETLKYEDGSYEWTFPMVVTPRYHPLSTTPGEANDTARISPPNTAAGMRAGHDISIELDLNAGMPILGIHSDNHDTDQQLVNERHAKVQLKDRVTIPNRNFVLKYRVAGNSINDAVLTHRSERGGYFTLILQPPQRVSPEDATPLLTDISIDWSGLPVTDVYPKQSPDLFTGKPLIFSGHYTTGAKGMIRLSAKRAGEDFVREIPVELPESKAENQVLAGLWARRKIDELILEEMTFSATQDQEREAITALGLNFKLMTPYTSFVTSDPMIFSGPNESQPVSVDSTAAHSEATGWVPTCTFIVSSVSLSSAITADSLQGLPLQGRSYKTFAHLTPGVIVDQSSGVVQVPETSRYADGAHPGFIVDKASANFAIAAGGESPGPTASGNNPALTASGGANGLATLDSFLEGRLEATARKAESGFSTGVQFDITTRSGANNFHGSAFHAFGNDSLDANDWFANARGLPRPQKSLNFFGGTFSGPIKHHYLFFFASYEGMRLRQPMVGVTDVPSLSSRAASPLLLRPFLNAFPDPNGPSRPDGFAEFASSFTNPARHDVGSFQIHYNATSDLTVKGRYSFADSSADKRGSDRLSLNTINRVHSRAQSVTGSASYAATPNFLIETFANYSRMRVSGSYLLDQFGGADVPSSAFAPGSFVFDLNSPSAGWMTGDDTASTQRQIHLGGSIARVQGDHMIKFGSDYRRLSPIIGVRTRQRSVLFDGIAQALSGIAGRQSNVNHVGSQQPVFESFSLFGQDDWRVSSRFTLNYGLRWEVASAPSTQDALAVDQVTDPAKLKASLTNGPLWKTTFANFGPRASFAYVPFEQAPDLLFRGGIGVLYDLGYGSSGDLFANSIPFISGSSTFNAPFAASSPAGSTANLPFKAFDPQLKLPYSIIWKLSVESDLGSRQNISAAYVGSTGERVLHTATLLNQNQDFPFLRLTTNGGSSDYRALQIRFQRRLVDGFMASAGYILAQSLDNVTIDSERTVVMTSANPALDRGPSDFDARHRFTGFASYAIPALRRKGITNKLSRNWMILSLMNARSARPLNAVYLFPTSFGVGYLRPDQVNEVPLYISDPAAPGGRRLNAAAFSAPSSLDQGTLPRNRLRGFPLYQVDFGLRRKFNFTEEFSLQIAAEAFNLLNHPNFEDPSGNELVIGSRFSSTNALTPNLAFGESRSLAGRSLASGGFASFYGNGGARTMKFTVKLSF